ncbi:PAS domain S-box protein [Desulfobulbus alkaliphilus]|uniref:PAS domain S-box protein n=1 Tax=Desulfobulbus alkaliphilus TaxID=869814 RepID=UPI001964A663|nr:PAS domain S-box protein [Desulfobulbus alkaliphilus]MBM9536068.1 PAS domain S-box protein [Desulfobulbus alkaliphilus]
MNYYPFHDAKNELKGVVSRALDITDRKRSEDALRESEARFRALHNASFGGIAIHDKGVILECNQGLSEISGFGYDELIGMDGLLLIAEQSREAVMRNIRSGYEQPYEAFGVRKNGEEYPLRLEARNIPHKGKTVRVVEFRDITERKRAEAEHAKLQEQLIQAQKMETVGRLAGGVAHDFNNMLGVILGYTEMTLEQVSPGHPMYKALHGIQQAAQRSADLTGQLLAFARKQAIAPRIIDLNETVERMLKMLRRLIGEDIDLIWLPGRNLEPIKMDPTQIDKILANLCINARDAIAGVGKVTIETAAASLDEAWCAVHNETVPGEYMLLAISDNGCGMDRETLSHLFEPFFTTKEQGKGTGLGLASVYGAVTQNKGFINVYSEPGQGTTFKIYLRAYGDQSAGVEGKTLELPAEHGSETILLVEDEPAILEMTMMMLERLGYTVLAAATPGEAIRLAHEHAGSIDLLMTDVVMPEMNGQELAGYLLAHSPNLKCLFMSGYTANVIAQHGVLDKGVHFIQKPFTMEDLKRKLGQTLNRE